MKWCVNRQLVAPAEDDEAEGVIEIEDEQEDIQVPKTAADPGQPTQRQVEDHRRFHIPYRLWCKWCVMGRGRGAPHRRRGESAIPIIGIDYFFITTSGVKRRRELEHAEDEAGEKAVNEARARGELVKCIIVRCYRTKIIMAHVVPCKGRDEDDYVATTVCEDIAWLGHTRMILKGDNEPALKSLEKRIIELSNLENRHVEQLGQEDPAKYDSQANGGTELGVMMIRGLFRTLKCCLEARINRTIPANHALVAWLIEHTCLLLNALVRGSDGMTPWARARGRPFGQQLLGFGEVVLYKLPSKGPQHHPEGNMGPQQREAVFLGHNRSSNTYRLASADGIGAARSITRRPLSERWQPEALAQIQATPWSIREKPETRVRFTEPASAGGETAETAQPSLPRRLRINQSDLNDHGYTDGCHQCNHIQRYGKARAGGQHSNRCRERLEKAIGESEAGKSRVEAHDERVTRAMAERVEHHAKAFEARAEQAPAAPACEPQVLGGAPREEPAADPEPAPRRAGVGPPERARVVRFEAEPEWQNVPLGEQAPQTPTLQARGASAEDLGDLLENDGDESAMEEQGEHEDVDMDFIGSVGSFEPSAEDYVMEMMLAQIGGSKSYAREKRKAMRHIVSEIYSPPRITKLIRELKSKWVQPGFALDLTVTDPYDNQSWDFTKAEKRERARRLFRKQRPFFLIGSPECTPFSTWQFLNVHKYSNPEAKRRARVEAEVHMRFVISLYYEQIEAGRFFLHEHPAWATSWSMDAMEQLEQVPSVQRVQGDQCQFGAEIMTGIHRGDPVKKPTGFLTNSEEVAKVLSKHCEGVGGQCSRRNGGTHRLCSGSHARNAARYPRGLCKAVLRGITNQLKVMGLIKDGCFGIQVPDEDAEILKEMYGPAQGYSGQFKDDLTGQVLRDDLVRAARHKELQYFNQKGVWKKVSKQIARSRSGRSPISVRWVDVNKGDEQNPNYRSRLVARQLKAHDHSGNTYFAPAPPLEALRTVISLAMTRIGDHRPDWNPASPTRTQLSFIDVSRAYFNAKIDPDEPPTFVCLPNEEPDSQDMCAQLMRHMYGTRMAADGWQEEYSTMLIRLGFRQGVACPNLFYHQSRKIVCSVHGDDFTSSGPRDALNWLEESIAKEYEITIQPRVGPGPSDAKEGRSLNRIIRWCAGHIEYEADPRQAERLVAECGLEGARAVATPGVKATFKELEEDSCLPKDLHTAFRGAAARSNYLAADRIDSQFACKEVCRWMASPTVHAWKALKRLCRFFNGAPRLVYKYAQQEVDAVDVYTDTDWSGCPKTRKSTSGGCILLGQHTVKHWSSTQPSVALSSGEAEFAGVIRGAGQGLGYQALLKDLGVVAPLRVWTDSSATIGICSRQGLGKMRHLDTHTLWIQQAVRSRRLELRKVDGERNPADLLTKHSLSRKRMEMLVDIFGCQYLDGRAESAPQLRRGESMRTTMAQASEGLGAVQGDDGNEEDQEWLQPVMPHLAYSHDEMDARHPRLQAPEEENLEDFADDTGDAVFQRGLALAREIQQQAVEVGRKRNTAEAHAADDQPETSSGSLNSVRLRAPRPAAGGVREVAACHGTVRTSTWSPVRAVTSE